MRPAGLSAGCRFACLCHGCIPTRAWSKISRQPAILSVLPVILGIYATSLGAIQASPVARFSSSGSGIAKSGGPTQDLHSRRDLRVVSQKSPLLACLHGTRNSSTLECTTSDCHHRTSLRLISCSAERAFARRGRLHATQHLEPVPVSPSVSNSFRISSGPSQLPDKSRALFFDQAQTQIAITRVAILGAAPGQSDAPRRAMSTTCSTPVRATGATVYISHVMMA